MGLKPVRGVIFVVARREMLLDFRCCGAPMTVLARDWAKNTPSANAKPSSATGGAPGHALASDALDMMSYVVGGPSCDLFPG